jgi:RNase P protein component
MTFKSKLMLNTSSRIAQSKHMNSFFQDNSLTLNINFFFFNIYQKQKDVNEWETQQACKNFNTSTYVWEALKNYYPIPQPKFNIVLNVSKKNIQHEVIRRFRRHLNHAIELPMIFLAKC